MSADASPPPAPARRAWLGPLLAALIAVLAGLPGVLAMPALDRDESRFAQATAQMLETGDYVQIRFLDEPRDKKPVGIHWLQAASVATFSSVEARDIWAYRLPSLLGAALAAAAAAWAAAIFWGGRAGLIAGAVLGASFLLSTEAGIAKTDAMLCGAVTLSMAALARIYAQWRADGSPSGPGQAKASRGVTVLFWSGLALALIVKGPVGPMVVGLAGLALWGLDRRAGWARRLRWGYGLVLVLAVTAPWAMAITVATDGAFWGAALGGDLAPKLTGGHESHGAPPGLHTLLSPALLFPATFLLPAAVAVAVAGWREPGVRFALAWLVPTWLVFELLPTKLVHYPLPAYGALALLIAASTTRATGRWPRALGALLSVLTGVAFAAVVAYAWNEYGDPSDLPVVVFAAAAAGLTGLAGVVAVSRQRMGPWLPATLALGMVAHGAVVGLVAPRLDPLWSSRAVDAALDRARLAPGEVAVTGYSEPSLVFALGTRTRLSTAQQAADLVAAGRPAVVEAAERPAFLAALAARGITATPIGEVRGLNYSRGDPVRLSLYRGRAPEAP